MSFFCRRNGERAFERGYLHYEERDKIREGRYASYGSCDRDFYEGYKEAEREQERREEERQNEEREMEERRWQEQRRHDQMLEQARYEDMMEQERMEQERMEQERAEAPHETD